MKNGMKIYTLYTSTVGFSAILLILLYALGITPPEKFVLNLEGMAIAALPIVLLNAYGFRPGMSKGELWVRRILYVFIGIMTCGISYAIVGLVKNTDMFLRILGGGFAVGILLAVPMYIVIDRQEKKNLQEINKKLSEQKEEETEQEENKEDWH